jgi:hypothetical protein
MTIWSITLTAPPGTATSWTVEGWSHQDTSALPFLTNQGRFMGWAAMACGPGAGAVTSWLIDLATNDAVLALITTGPPTTGITDFVSIGVPVTTLPFVPIGNPPIWCQPQIDTSVASYIVPIPQGLGTLKQLARIPWLPAYNYTAMWGQVLRWDAVSGTFLWLALPTHFTTHYHLGTGVPMPGNARFNGSTQPAGNTRGPVIGWR